MRFSLCLVPNTTRGSVFDNHVNQAACRDWSAGEESCWAKQVLQWLQVHLQHCDVRCGLVPAKSLKDHRHRNSSNYDDDNDTNDVLGM